MEVCSNPALALMSWCLITDILPSPGMLSSYCAFAFRKLNVCELKCLFISAMNLIYNAMADLLCQAPGKT
jgi:hypothetical protein